MEFLLWKKMVKSLRPPDMKLTEWNRNSRSIWRWFSLKTVYRKWYYQGEFDAGTSNAMFFEVAHYFITRLTTRMLFMQTVHKVYFLAVGTVLYTSPHICRLTLGCCLKIIDEQSWLLYLCSWLSSILAIEFLIQDICTRFSWSNCLDWQFNKLIHQNTGF